MPVRADSDSSCPQDGGRCPMRHPLTAALLVCVLACGGESTSGSTLSSSSHNATGSGSSALLATPVSPTEIDLAWHPSSTPVSGWQVHRSANPSGVYALVANLPAAANGYA